MAGKGRTQAQTTSAGPLAQREVAVRGPGGQARDALRWGWGLYSAGEYADAARVARECSASGDPEPAYLLGIALKASGDRSGAAAAFKAASEIASGAGDPVRASMLRRLAIGQVNWLLRGEWDLEPETWVRT